LKHLIREKDDAREITTEWLCFPKLRSLSISYCGKLEYAFPVSVSRSLLNLEEMEIDFADNVILHWRRRCTHQRWNHQVP
jgi:hypothetical protein